MLELLANSTNDYSVDRMAHHLYRCGRTVHENLVGKWLDELVDEGLVLFVGWEPLYLHDGAVFIGRDAIFGSISTPLIKSKSGDIHE